MPGAVETEKPAKRLKTGEKKDPSPIRAGLYDEGSVSAHRKEFLESGPYRHAVIQDLCDPETLRQVREEIINNLDASFKETDIYKVYQTGDLANMSRLDEASLARLPRLDSLRRHIYGPEFRSFVRTITGCDELTDRTDLSCNCYAKGCHLLCHDDVIGTRCISFIIYLTDPDDVYTEEDGGALELFPLEAPDKLGVPAVYPTKVILPKWNQMVFFTVLPGESFHSVQEVFSDGKPRLSISGWFHTKEPPKGSEQATLAQLQNKSVTEASSDMLPLSLSPSAKDSPGGLTAEELEHLGKYINPDYLKGDIVDKIKRNFRINDDSMQLASVLKADLARRIGTLIKRADRKDGLGSDEIPEYRAGETDHWRSVGPPHKHRYLSLREDPGASDELGQLLWDIRTNLMANPAFAKLLAYVSSADLKKYRGEIRRFRPGLDYTIAHFGQLDYQDHRLDCTLCFVDDQGEIKQAVWENDNAGGFESYMEAEEENGAQAAEVYRRPERKKQAEGKKNEGNGAGQSELGGEGEKGEEEDDDDEDAPLLSVSAAHNTLNIVLRPPGVMRFIKYVSASAPGSRWDISMEFEADAPDDEEDAEGEEKAEGKE